MQTKTTHLKLPFNFNESSLLTDLAKITASNWVPHFNTQGYSGAWNAIALYAPGGDASNIFAHNTNQEALTETSALKACAYFKQVINTFKCPVLNARILKLDVGAIIKPHTDYKLGYEDNNFRVHIPIVTNKDVAFILAGERLTMLPGECWYTNVNHVHEVTNAGQEDRVHMVLDLERNSWSDALFFGLAPEASFQLETQEHYDSETMIQIIAALEQRNEPRDLELIEELKSKQSNLG